MTSTPSSRHDALDPRGQARHRSRARSSDRLTLAQAESTLAELAGVFLSMGGAHASPDADAGTGMDGDVGSTGAADRAGARAAVSGAAHPRPETRYQALVEQIPAVVFMANLDAGISEAYVSPQIEASLGFSRDEWLEDPVRWYSSLHPDDKDRWSIEAADLFLTGRAVRSAYRVVARDGTTVWFHCEANMIRRDDGRPWFIHGVGFDITELKRVEHALEGERNLLSAVLDTAAALVVVLDARGRIVRLNRACELLTGHSFESVRGRPGLDVLADDSGRFEAEAIAEQLHSGATHDFESRCRTRDGSTRLVTWSTRILAHPGEPASHVIATGIDITERRRLEQAIMEVSTIEQRRVGHDLHDDLGQHLTGIALMSKVLERRLTDRALPEAAEAATIARLVNEAINRTRELARGLQPVPPEPDGLMAALSKLAGDVSEMFGVSCRLQCDAPVTLTDARVATHLYHVAQEATNNAVRHGRATHIVIRLTARDGFGTVVIEDDGRGFPAAPTDAEGMGLQIMSHRASAIGGALSLDTSALGGGCVSCRFPLADEA